VFQRGLTPPDPFRPRVPLEELRTQDAMSVKVLGELGPLLLVFLPALGGIFCRELLERVRESRPAIEKRRVRLILIHMGEADEDLEELARFDLQYVARIADPERELYGHFELGESKAVDRLRPAVLGRALGAMRHGRGRRRRRATNQLPGAVHFRDGSVLGALRPASPGESMELLRLLG